METNEFSLRLEGWRLATAEVLYYMPDHPSLLQSFMWQTLDLAPSYPRIHKFLNYWRSEIDAVIHSVRLATGKRSRRQRSTPPIIGCITRLGLAETKRPLHI
ncbi:MAG: protein usg [Hyphomonadaceae bacterium JAD_PAG50586_4]|nr:MAG: protein usg [Hyphomonadaceae bacterium JAD_PAG50586_4]